MLIPGEKCRHFIPGKKFQGKNVDIFSPRIENSIPRNGEIVFLEKRARHHLNPLVYTPENRTQNVFFILYNYLSALAAYLRRLEKSRS